MLTGLQVAGGQDSSNCGHCAACAGPSAVCFAGQCACAAPGLDYCVAAASCVDIASEVSNCGACGMVCDPTQFTQCQDSQCAP